MAWYDSAVFYHIYPLGLCGCSKENTGEEEHHFDKLKAWADHAAKMNFTGIYIGPLFESVGHGYETTDYKKVDCRLGSNEEFKEYVSYCHKLGIKVIVDGVFNHVGREFFAFKDVKEKRESSPYCGWFCNLHFGGNNEYNDGFSYDNWGGYNLLVKLNQRHPDVQNYLTDVIRFWVSEFDIDGIRLDAADVLDFDFMKVLRRLANEVKPDFWLMGEVIHGDYSRWTNDEMLHSVTNYELHKGLFSGHNDHNYFEIAHSIKRLNDICRGRKLYTFVDNHDVERIASKLNNKAHLPLVTMLLYTIYGIPSVYYGSEFGVEGRKEKGSDWNLRPALDLKDYATAYESNMVTKLCMKLGHLKKTCRELTEGEYRELYLRNRQFAFGRVCQESAVITALNCDDAEAVFEFQAPVSPAKCKDLLGMAKQIDYQNGHLRITLEANTGTVFMLSNTITDEDSSPLSGSTASDNVNNTVASENTASDGGNAADTSVNGDSKPAESQKPTAFGTRNPASRQNLGGMPQPACQVRLDGFGIMANDIRTMVEFYSNVLGFAIHYTDGMRNVCLEKDGTVFMLYGREDFENLTSQKYPQINGFKGHFQIALHVENYGAVDYTFQTVVNQGGRSILGPKTEEWGQRICYVADPEGNVIEISSFQP